MSLWNIPVPQAEEGLVSTGTEGFLAQNSRTNTQQFRIPLPVVRVGLGLRPTSPWTERRLDTGSPSWGWPMWHASSRVIHAWLVASKGAGATADEHAGSVPLPGTLRCQPGGPEPLHITGRSVIAPSPEGDRKQTVRRDQSGAPGSNTERLCSCEWCWTVQA